MPARDGVDLAKMYVGYYGITAQAEGESNADFRARVAGALRRENKIVDAHEVFTNRYHDEKPSGDDLTDHAVTDGIAGALKLVLDGNPVAERCGPDYARLETEQVAGTLTRLQPDRDEAADNALVMLAMMLGGGPRR